MQPTSLIIPETILAVCIGNQNRSPTLEEYIFRKLIKRGYKVEKDPTLTRVKGKIIISSSGVVAGKTARQFTREQGDRADLILAVEKAITYCLNKNYSQPLEKIRTLEIYDIYDDDPQGLVRELDLQVLPILDEFYPRG
ncbi:hypothetical protein FJZ17_03750 [Candidatus Pacearchaeota archaeon]|nr:hypothetical protein [Candidatus Pacearchaeota archaeon]